MYRLDANVETSCLLGPACGSPVAPVSRPQSHPSHPRASWGQHVGFTQRPIFCEVAGEEASRTPIKTRSWHEEHNKQGNQLKPTEASCVPTEASCDPTQASCNPTEATCNSTETVCNPTEASCKLQRPSAHLQRPAVTLQRRTVFLQRPVETLQR
jgi:hypothetical protein